MRIVFVCDNFVEDLIGGSELSLQTHINSCPFEYVKIRSVLFRPENFNRETDFIVFGNMFHVQYEVLLQVIREGWGYVVEECDYKYCRYRESHFHAFMSGRPCDCRDSYRGRTISAFYAAAKHLFWKSEGQRAEYYRLFPALESVPSSIMGGVFSDADIDYILSLRGTPRDEKFVILKSEGWVKGYLTSKEFCEKNGLQYREIGGLPHRDALAQMARSAGVVYMPQGFDVSCRMITEAKLLGIEIHTNDLVQHTKEAWFNGTDEDRIAFLRGRDKEFWKTINELVLVAA